MKDEELKLEEIEASHTLGGAGRCYAAVEEQDKHASFDRKPNVRACQRRMADA